MVTLSLVTSPIANYIVEPSNFCQEKICISAGISRYQECNVVVASVCSIGMFDRALPCCKDSFAFLNGSISEHYWAEKLYTVAVL